MTGIYEKVPFTQGKQEDFMQPVHLFLITRPQVKMEQDTAAAAATNTNVRQ